MDAKDALALLDEAACRLVRGYANRESVAYVVRLLDTGEVRIIGPSLPADVVADLFGKAAQGYADSDADKAGSLN